MVRCAGESPAQLLWAGGDDLVVDALGKLAAHLVLGRHAGLIGEVVEPEGPGVHRAEV